MIATCLVLALMLPLQAPDAASQVRSLVREFDAGQKSARDEAERRLIELGPAALEHLPTITADDSAEFGLRINRVRQALLRAKAESNLIGSTVTFSVVDAPLADVLAEFERQTGNTLVDYRRAFGQQADEIRVTLGAKQLPFWKAFDALASAAKLEPYPFAAQDGLALVARKSEADGDAIAAPTSDAGAFRTRLRKLTLVRDFERRSPMLELELETAWEPRLRPMFFTAAAAQFQVVDDGGTTLVAENPDLVLEVPPQGRASQVGIKFTVAAPARPVRSLARIAGRIDVLLPADQHTFRFADIADGKRQEQRAAAATVAVDGFRDRDGVWEIRLRLRYAHPANALESHRAWFYKNPAYLEAPDGARTPPGTIELLRQSDDELTLNLLFPAPDDAASRTFVYQTPADLVVLPIPLEFRNLPLP